MDFDTDVCVIGGGPAGATIARLLRRFGHRVCLVDSGAIARAPRGQSLPPGILPLLDALGIRDRVEGGGFVRTSGYLLRWAGPSQFRTWGGAEQGFYVDRARFDGLLRDIATEDGVVPLQPRLATRPEQKSGRWFVPLRNGGAADTLRAQFLVLASGRRPVLPCPCHATSEPLTALYSTVDRVRGSAGESCVDTSLDSWLWGGINSDGSADVAAFVDPRRCREAGRTGLEELFNSLVMQSPLLSELAKSSSRSPVQACSASSYVASECVAPGLLRVGDASFCIDPLSSQGMKVALQAAFQGAITIHTLMAYPGDTDAALEFYRSRRDEAVSQHRAWAAGYYRAMAAQSPSEFWQARSSPELIPDYTLRPTPAPLPLSATLSRSLQTQILSTPIIEGDRIRAVDGIVHPALARPIVFLDGFEVASLVKQLVRSQTVGETLRIWSERLGARRAARVLSLLVERSVIAVSPTPAQPTVE